MTRQDAAMTVETRIGRLEFNDDFANGYPTKETVDKLYDERDFQPRASLCMGDATGGVRRAQACAHGADRSPGS